MSALFTLGLKTSEAAVIVYLNILLRRSEKGRKEIVFHRQMLKYLHCKLE